jgi:hypothetical protein
MREREEALEPQHPLDHLWRQADAVLHATAKLPLRDEQRSGEFGDVVNAPREQPPGDLGHHRVGPGRLGAPVQDRGFQDRRRLIR